MTGENNDLPPGVSTNEDLTNAMSSEDQTRAERATAPPTPVRGSDTVEDVWSGSVMTIEQRYELESTLTRLELEDGQVGIPIGADDRYLLRKLLGRGSMGAVYLAEDVELDREVAIKVVSRRIEQERMVLQLRREARGLAAIDHPNVVKIFDIGSEHGEDFIAMEYVDGQNLRAWQEDRSQGHVIEAYLDAGRGLAAIHRRGLVHRDFKPDNVLVDEHEGHTRVRVGDFGLAGHGPDASGVCASTGTATLGVLGTPQYMAPEQLRGERAEVRSDQHQFCVSLWEAITGGRPFGPNARPVDANISVPPCPATMPRWSYRVLRRGLAFEPHDRYPSMDALLAALRRGRRWHRARPVLVAVGLAAAAGAAMVVLQPGPCETAASRMAAIWTNDARADIHAAFGSSEPAGRLTMSSYLVEGLDHAAARWSKRAVEACEAREAAPTHERPALERREECLVRWAQRMQSRIEWLRNPDDAGREHAFELVAPLSHAGDSCTLPRVLIDASVEDALEDAEEAELLRELDRAKDLAAEAVELASTRGVLCPAKGPDDAPRSSEQAAALFRLGHVLSERGESRAALDMLVRAHQHAHACHDEHRDAAAKIHAAKVLVIDVGDDDAASAALDDAWVALGEVEEPEVSLLRYDERLAAGVVAELRGEYEVARRRAEEGRAALGESPDPVLEAKLDLNIGVAWDGQGNYAEAAAAYERATQRVSGALGEEHPQTRRYAAQRDLNLGLAAQERGDHGQMRRSFEQATAWGEAPVVVKGLTAWAQGELEAGDRNASLVRTAALVTFLSRSPELPPVTLATAETTAGQLLVTLGGEGSIAILERACARWRELGGPDELASCELALGHALRIAGRVAEAQRLCEHLRSLDVDTMGPLPRAIDDLARSLEPEPTEAGSAAGSAAGPDD